MTWGSAGDSGGGDVTYHWSLSSGQSGQTTGNTATVGGLPAGNYSFTVYATNPGGTSGSTSSNQVNVPAPPSSWTVTLNSGGINNSCPESNFQGGSHFSSTGPSCSSAHQFVPGGSTITIYCYVTAPGGWSPSGTWYLFSGPGQNGSYTEAEGWHITASALTSNPTGVPGC
jgi:hypothetical protein